MADGSNASIPDHTSLLLTLKNGYVLARMDRWHWRSCFLPLYAKSDQGWTWKTVERVIRYKARKEAVELLVGHSTRVRDECRFHSRPLKIGLSLSCWKGFGTTALHLWRITSCHFWEQFQVTFCRTWYGLTFSMEWSPLHIDSTCTLEMSHWDTCVK